MSPENKAADFGTSLPFNQAAPFVYNMADAVSPASIVCAGNRIASKQHIAHRSLDSDMGSDHSNISGLFYPKPVKGYRSMRLFCLSSIILSPPNGNVKMSPHERKDIRVESEGTATSERDFRLP
jgi:hypothetical protein